MVRFHAPYGVPMNGPEHEQVAAIDRMAAQPLDVLVIGGGIVGSGIARDAAMRGLRVGLVEQYDFASGTSSRSSRLLHGGLRYLAQGRIGLVREASLEKRVLHGIAPHVAEPLPFVFPSYRGTPWPLWQLRIGVKFYDLLCSGRNLGRSESLGMAQTSALLPGVARRGLKGAVRYFDGLTNDARLVIDTLRSASRHGAMLQNYCRFERGRSQRPALAGRGARRAGRSAVRTAVPLHRQRRRTVGRSLSPEPRAIADDQGRAPGDQPRPAADPQRGRASGRQTHPVRHPLAAAGDPGHDRHRLPGEHRGHRLRAGRLAVRAGGGQPGIPRSPLDRRGRDQHVGRPAAAGGQLARQAVRHFPCPRDPDERARLVGHRRRKTDHLPADGRADGGPGGGALGPEDAARAGRPQEPLLDSAEVGERSGIAPPAVEQAAVEHYCRHEWAAHLQDVMIRRTSWHHYWPEAPQMAERVAGWMAASLGWSTEQTAAELAAYQKLCRADRACCDR